MAGYSIQDALKERKKRIENEESSSGTESKSSGSSQSGSYSIQDALKARKDRINNTATIQDWADAVTVLIGDIDKYHKNWHSSYDSGYADLSLRSSNLLTKAKEWSEKFSGNSDVESSINDYVSALNQARDYSDRYRKYYSQWETENDYNRALKRSTTEGRLELYEEDQKRLEELKKERDSAYPTNFDYGLYSTPNAAYAAYTAQTAQRRKELDDEIEALEAEINTYKRTQYVVDKYERPETEEFKQNAAYRNYSNASREELLQYDMSASEGSTALSNGGYFDEAGNIRDSKGNIVQYASAPVVEDKLGLFLSASDADIADAYNELSATNGNYTNTWANIIQEGDTSAWKELDDHEIDIYYDIYKRDGQEAAYKFLSDMTTELTRRETEKRTKEINGATALEQLALNIAYLPMNIVGGVTAFVDDASSIISGEEINPYSRAHLLQNASQDITAKTASDINNMTGNASIPYVGTTFGDAYQAIMSAGSSILGVATTGPAYRFIMGMNAASAEMKKLYEQGASMNQIAKGGFLAGAAETFFEKYSIDHYIKMGSAKTLTDAFVNFLKQGGVEASEEMATEFANLVSNAFVMGSQSDWQSYRDKYLREGYSQGASIVLALLKDAGPGILNAGVGGFISGGVMGGGKSAVNLAQNEVQVRSDGRAIQSTPGGVDALLQLATEMSEGASGNTQKTISKLSEQVSGEKPSARKVGRLYQYAGNAVSDSVQSEIASGLEKSGMSAKEAGRYAKVIVAEMNGESLSDRQKLTLKKAKRSEAVQQVVSEVASNTESKSAGMSRKLALFTAGVNMGLDMKKKDGGTVTEVTEGTEATPDAPTMAENHFVVSEDTQTTVEGREGPVTIKSIESNSDGNLLLRLDDGSVVDASDVSYGSADEAFVFSAIADLGLDAKSSTRILDAFKNGPTMTGELFANGIKQAFMFGSLDMPGADLKTGAFTRNLSADQRVMAYQLGQKFGEEKTASADAKVRQAVAENATTTDKSYVTGRVHYEGFDKSGFTERQKVSVDALETIAEALGIQFHLFESELITEGKYKGKRKGENGKIQTIDGVTHIWIDIESGTQGNQAMLYTAAHELTHFMKKKEPGLYKRLCKFIMQEYGEHGKSVDYMVRKQIDKAKNARNVDLSYEDAYEEFICDSMETMLSDGKVIAKLKQQDRTLWEKIKDYITDLVNKIKKAYSGMKADSREGQLLAEWMNESVSKMEEIQSLFAEGLVKAGENYQASLTPGQESTVYAQNGDPVAHVTEEGSVQLSIRTYEEEGRSAFREYLEKCVSSKKLTKSEMQEMIDGIEEIYQVCKQFKDKYAPFGTWSDAAVVRDTYGKPVFSVVTPNGEYKMNLDFSLVCKKRRTLDAVFNEMSRRGIIDDFELGQKSVVKINEIIRNYGFETACALCFVDAKRFRQASMEDSFVNLYNELVTSLVPESKRGSIGYFNFSGNSLVKEVSSGIDTWSDSDLDFTHIDEVLANYGKGTVEYKAAKYIKFNSEARRLLQRGDFMSSQGFDAVKSQNKTILKLYNSKKGTGGPKAAFGDVQYMNEIIKKARTWTPAKAYSVGGVRIQSFSDYVPRMVFDYVQMVYDLSATGLPAHAYTKEALFAKQFGLTGIKINMSLIPAIAKGGIAAGLDANGNYVWAGESFDFETAKEIQNAEGYTENCGTICVGVSDLHIRKLLSDPNIRMVIPYHKSGLNPIVAHMNRIAEFTDYTGSQNTLDRNGKKVAKDFDFNRALHKMGANGDPKAVISEYLEWCDSQGYTPRFSQFRDHPNYYKLIEDFTLYDKNGNYVPQREVRAVFPTEGSAFGSMKSLIESGLQEDAVIEGKIDKSLSSIVDEIERTLPKTEAEIAETEVVQADRDLESELSDAGIKYSSRVTDDDTLSFLDGQETITTYKTMQIVDGKLYPPMASRIGGKYEDYSELGVWEQATEHPELIRGNGKFKLDKGKGQGSIEAAYNPYMHSSNLVINDQFSGAYKRTNLVTVECVVPVSEATSGYHAQYAKDSVGWHPWHTGTVAGSIRKAKGVERQVFLSRWIKPVRIVPDSEVASMYKELLSGTDVAVPDNVVTPSLLEELKKAGVKIEESGRVKYSDRDSSDYSEMTYDEISEEQQRLYTEELNLNERKRDAENNPELLKAMDEFTSLLSEMTYLIHKRKNGTASQNDLDRIEEIKRLREEYLKRIADIQERIGLNDIVKQQDAIREKKDALRKASDEAWSREGSEKERKAIEKSGLSSDEYFRKKAIKEFHYTANFNEAGYLLPNGKMLDFSGGERNNRYRDHREIGAIYEATQGAAALNRFMNDGNIRIMAESPGIDLASGVEPTSEQYSAIRRFINSNGRDEGMFYVDFSDKEGRSVGKYSYEGNVRADRVINDIKYFYENGSTREQSSLSMFYSYRDPDAITDRSLLANAFENLAQYPDEARAIQRYKEVADKLDAEQRKLSEIRGQIKELSFSKGPKDTEKIKALRFEANKIANRINTYDKKLLKLSAAKPLQDVLQREKKSAYKRAEKKGRESLAAYKERVERENRERSRKYRERVQKRKDSDARTQLLNIAKRLQRIKTTQANRAWIDSIIGDLDTVAKDITGRTVEALTDLRDWYENEKQNNPDFIPDQATEDRIARLSKRPISTLTLDEVKQLTQVFQFIENQIRTQKSVINSRMRTDIYHAASISVDDIRKSGKARKKTGIAHAIDKKLVLETLSPVREIRRLTGYVDSDPLYILTEELEDGQRSMLDFQMRAERMFSKWTNDKKFIRRVTGSKAEEIKVTGSVMGEEYTVSITPAMRMSLYMHSLNAENMNHVMNGGVKIPDIKLYKQGKTQAAYDAGVTVRFTPSQISKIASGMTEQERAFCKQVTAFFDGMSQQEINAVSEQLKGYSLALVKNYFPINTDTDFTTKEFEAVQVDGTIEGLGMLKERKAKASNPIMLRDINDVLTQSITMSSKYVGLAIPVRNFQKVWNADLANWDDAGNKYSHQDGVKKAIRTMWGSEDISYVDKFMSDIQMPRGDSDSWGKVFNKVRSNYAGAVLTFNLSVALKQAASYPTAGAVLGFAPLAKAMKNAGKVDLALIEKYTPLQWYRSKGYSTTELGDIKSSETLMGKLMSVQVKGVGVTNWVQTMDVLTTRKLWKASEYYVHDNNKNLEVGSDAFYRAVADIYNRVIEETQPNYTAMQRPQMLRSDNALIQTLSMFKTQPFQNFNIVYDAAGNYIAKLSQHKAGGIGIEEVKKAKRGLANAVISQALQLAVFAGMTFAWAVFRKKDDKYKDEETGDITASSWLRGYLRDILSGMFGCIPFGSDLFEFVDAKINDEKYYGFEATTISAVNDMVGAVEDIGSFVTSMLDPETDKSINNLWPKIDAIIAPVSNVLGIPVKNVENIFYAVFHWAVTSSGKYTGEYKYMRATTSMSENMGKYYDLLFDARSDPEQYEEIRQSILETGIATEDDIDNAMLNRIKKYLSEYDTRIHDAAVAKVNGDLDEYMRLSKSIIAEGEFDQNEVVKAVNAEINKLSKKDDTPSEKKSSGLFVYADFDTAISQGDSAMANAIKVDIIQTSQKNGKTAEEAEDDFSSSAKSRIKEMVMNGTIDKSKAVNALTTYCGIDDDDAESDVEYWMFTADNPDVYASDSWFDTYFEKVQSSGVSISLYMDYRNKASECKADLDENGNSISGSRKKKLLPIIDSLPITSSQKDALYYAEGWAESKLYEAPWH